MGAVGALVIILDAGPSFGLHRTTCDLMMHWRPPLLGLLFLVLSLTFFRAALDLFAYRKKLGRLCFVTGAGYVTHRLVPSAAAPDLPPDLIAAAFLSMGLVPLVAETIAYVNISSTFSRARQVAKEDWRRSQARCERFAAETAQAPPSDRPSIASAASSGLLGRMSAARTAPWIIVTVPVAALLLPAWTEARADEGGASFWVPGQYAASLAATPPTPGWSVPAGVYYYSGRAPASASVSSAVAPGTRSQSLQLSVTPTYAPKAAVLGGQLALMLSVGAGSDATQGDAATPPGSASQTVWGALDAVPAATLSWQRGAHSWMAYVTGNVPVGSYEPQRLSNVGIGHAALDAGGVYTFESAATEHSVSAALGFTWNATNPDTDYRNGIDSHLGVSAMLPLSGAVRAGLSAYVYYQLTADSGGGDTCGACKSRVAGIGPQLNWTYAVAGQSWSLNLRGYFEFWARNRLEGYALFATLAIPLGGGS